jgi:hypothetical protein
MKTLRYTLKAGICVLYFLLPQRIYATSADSLALELLKVGNRWVYEYFHGSISGHSIIGGFYSESVMEKGRRTISIDSLLDPDSSGIQFFLTSTHDTLLRSSKTKTGKVSDSLPQFIIDSIVKPDSVINSFYQVKLAKGTFNENDAEFLLGYAKSEGSDQDFQVRNVLVDGKPVTLNTLCSYSQYQGHRDTAIFMHHTGMISYQSSTQKLFNPFFPSTTVEYKLITFNDIPVPWYELQIGGYSGVVTKNHKVSRNMRAMSSFKKSTLLFDQSKGINHSKGVGVDLCGRRFSSSTVVKRQCKGVYVLLPKQGSGNNIKQ